MRRTFAAAERTADELVEEAKRLLRKSAEAPFEIRQIALKLGLTPVQFTRRFAKGTGQTPLDYVTALRIGKACRLLEETDETLDSIAEQCGYESGFYLSRLFLKQKGLRPSEYRKRYRV
nr:AraC family transcriptional regulator [Paenibacillus caui]